MTHKKLWCGAVALIACVGGGFTARAADVVQPPLQYAPDAARFHCADKFVRQFLDGVRRRDVNVCFDTSVPLTYFPQDDDVALCTLPSRVLHPTKLIPFKFSTAVIYEGGREAGCVSEFAIDVGDATACSALKGKSSLTVPTGLSLTPFNNCILNYTGFFPDAALCEQLPKDGEPFGDYYQCLKLISWHTGDRHVCEKIPATPRGLHDVCVNGH